jgi:hypothetical protein
MSWRSKSPRSRSRQNPRTDQAPPANPFQNSSEAASACCVALERTGRVPRTLVWSLNQSYERLVQKSPVPNRTEPALFWRRLGVEDIRPAEAQVVALKSPGLLVQQIAEIGGGPVRRRDGQQQGPTPFVLWDSTGRCHRHMVACRGELLDFPAVCERNPRARPNSANDTRRSSLVRLAQSEDRAGRAVRRGACRASASRAGR